MPKKDVPNRINYQINYGVWDAIKGDLVYLEDFDGNVNNYDVVFLPMYKRWFDLKNDKNEIYDCVRLLNNLKKNKVKTVLFDNDSYYRSFDDDFYLGIDFIFYRCADSMDKVPQRGAWLPWSVNENLYTPKYGGKNILFNCSTNKDVYPLRHEIAKIIRATKHNGGAYIKALQNSGTIITASSSFVTNVNAKILEAAACGTQIISNRAKCLEWYFPKELIIYFNSIKDLKKIISSFKPDVKIQKQLRRIVEQRHTNDIRAKWVVNTLKERLWTNI